MARCQEMSTLPDGYILQSKVPLASSSGLLAYYLYPVANTVRPSVNITDRWYRLWARIIVKARPSAFLESRSWWVHDCGKQTNNQYPVGLIRGNTVNVPYDANWEILLFVTQHWPRFCFTFLQNDLSSFSTWNHKQPWVMIAGLLYNNWKVFRTR